LDLCAKDFFANELEGAVEGEREGAVVHGVNLSPKSRFGTLKGLRMRTEKVLRYKIIG
jgi:hypothetical protein